MSDPRPLVVLTVGTDSHPYDRAVRWVDAWAAAHPDARVVAQWGTSQAPTTATGGPLLPRPELEALLADAHAVVSHGGPATLHQVRGVGTLPLCIPRDPALGEHIDDHQQRFARHQADHGRIVHVTDEQQLHGLLDAVLTDPTAYAIDPEADEAAADRAVDRFGAMLDALGARDRATIDQLHADALRDTGQDAP